ncbi:MAG: flagellar FlbD family protein [Acetivibrio ethanolgignens]
MIEVTRMNDTKYMVNAELIETVEETPDTVLTLTTGKKLVVRESSKEIRNRIIAYKKEIFL